MRILQLNIQSLNNNNKDLLEMFLEINDIHISLLCETWLKDNSKSNIANYKFIYKNRPDGFGGVGISFCLLDLDIDAEVIGIQSLNLKEIYNFIVAYIPPNTPRARFDYIISSIFNFADNFVGPTIVAGDFNSKSTLWGNTSSDNHGRFLADVISRTDFCMSEQWRFDLSDVRRIRISSRSYLC